jgi:hypothetical protein
MKKFIITLTIFGGIIGGTILIKKIFKENNSLEPDTDDKLVNRMVETGM